jgi:hypothetical protein
MGLGYRTCSSSRGVYADAYGAGYQAGASLMRGLVFGWLAARHAARA